MRHAPTLALALSFTALASVGAGCVNALDVADDGDAAPVFVAEGDDLLDSFALSGDEGFYETHVIAAPSGFTRIGLRFDAVGPVAVEGRFSNDGGATFSPWRAATVSFAEGAAHNASVDVDADADAPTGLQLRFAAPVESQLTFLAVDAFVVDGDAAVADDAGLVQGASEEQALTGDLVRPRSAWRARSRSCNDPHTPKKVSIHHTETPTNDSLSVEARLRQIQSYHIDVRGWCDIGYHFLVASDGSIWQGRPENHVAAHVSGANTDNVGISLIGNYMTSPPSSQMQQAVVRLLSTLGRAYGIPLDRSHVRTHREQGQTDCPGNQVQSRINDLVNAANSANAPPPPPEEPAPSSCAQVQVVGASTLNVRPTASTARAPVATVNEGDVVDSSGAVEGQSVNGTSIWYGVVVGSGSSAVRGFISGAYARCVAGSDDADEDEDEDVDEDGVYDGVDRGTASIPRAGLANDTLRGALGVSTEPYGALFQYEGRDWVRGRVSHFGGPNDTGVTTTETGALTGERLRSLNSPVNASAATIASRPADFYYVAMRWDYTPHGASFWRNARVVVVNPANGKGVVLRPVDWGPNTSTRRILDVSPQALKDLGARTDDNLLVAFARDGAPLGVVVP